MEDFLDNPTSALDRWAMNEVLAERNLYGAQKTPFSEVARAPLDTKRALENLSRSQTEIYIQSISGIRITGIVAKVLSDAVIIEKDVSTGQRDVVLITFGAISEVTFKERFNLALKKSKSPDVQAQFSILAYLDRHLPLGSKLEITLLHNNHKALYNFAGVGEDLIFLEKLNEIAIFRTIFPLAALGTISIRRP